MLLQGERIFCAKPICQWDMSLIRLTHKICFPLAWDFRVNEGPEHWLEKCHCFLQSIIQIDFWGREIGSSGLSQTLRKTLSWLGLQLELKAQINIAFFLVSKYKPNKKWVVSGDDVWSLKSIWFFFFFLRKSLSDYLTHQRWLYTAIIDIHKGKFIKYM